jgi:chemotaxis-related protein WspB
MLLLRCLVNGDAYALDCRRVVEVVPWVPLRSVPRAPAHHRGLLHFRGEVISVFDLAVLCGAPPCQPRLSTRIVVVQVGAETVGLLAESVLDLELVRDADLSAGLSWPGIEFLGPVIETPRGLVQLIDVERLPIERAIPVAVG